MNTKLLATSSLALALAGCMAHRTPSKSLIEARQGFDRLARTPAAVQDKQGMKDARLALDHAEWANNNDPGSSEALDKAYLALRKVNTIEARARGVQARNDRAEAERELELLTSRDRLNQEQLAAAQAARLAAEGQLSEAEQSRLATEGQLSQMQADLEAERQARADAERQSQELNRELAKIANVQETSRGLVLTLSGSVLFKSGKSTLLPTARDRLNQVAEALKESDRAITIEGHTDSRGSAALNDALSKARAEAVRGYLAERGVPAEKMQALGLGPERPIAENHTAEGRANNRRVEIVIAPPSRAAAPERGVGGSGKVATPPIPTETPPTSAQATPNPQAPLPKDAPPAPLPNPPDQVATPPVAR